MEPVAFSALLLLRPLVSPLRRYKFLATPHRTVSTRFFFLSLSFFFTRESLKN